MPSENMTTKEQKNKQKSALINNALGLFVFLFGIIVLFAIFFSNTFAQKMADMVAGLVLCIIGGGMMLKSRITLKKLKLKDQDNPADH